MEARLHRLSIPDNRALDVALLVVVALVALGIALVVGEPGAEGSQLARATSTQSEPAFVPTGFGRSYDVAVGRLVWTNHELETRQTRLAEALRSNADPARVARLRRQ